MSQRIVTECDGDHDEPVDARTVEVRALGYAVEVDLCEVHEKELRDLVERFAEVGRTIGEATSTRIACPRCSATFKSADSLRGHVRTKHGETLAGATGMPVTPSPSPVDDNRRAPLPCPECGETYLGPQGLGAHRRAAHGVAGTSPK